MATPNNTDNTQAPSDPQVAPSENQKSQYVITQKSLSGIGGWLLFFMVIFALIGVGGISLFFTGLDAGVKSATDTVTILFSPLIAIAYLGATVLLAMRKKLAVFFVYAALAVMATYTILLQLMDSEDKSGVGVKVGTILVTLVMYGLLALYFRQSRRIKETLVK